MKQFWSSLRAAAISLICGWAVALLIGAGLALLQYQEVARAFPPERVGTEYQSRIGRELWQGSLLLYVQVGVLCGVLWWRVATTAANGLLAGAIVAIVQSIAAMRLQSSLLFWIPLALIIVEVGIVSERWRFRSVASPSRDTSSADQLHP